MPYTIILHVYILQLLSCSSEAITKVDYNNGDCYHMPGKRKVARPGPVARSAPLMRDQGDYVESFGSKNSILAN